MAIGASGRAFWGGWAERLRGLLAPLEKGDFMEIVEKLDRCHMGINSDEIAMWGVSKGGPFYFR